MSTIRRTERCIRGIPDGLVHPLALGSPESVEVVRYLGECDRSQGLRSRVTAEGAVSLAGYRTLRVTDGSVGTGGPR